MVNSERTKYLDNIIKKINNKSLKISVIGLGYVGLPRALTFCKKNIKVLGIDINKKKINHLNAGRSYIRHINSETINQALDRKNLYPSYDFSLIKSVDAIIICVPTPLLGSSKEPDLSFIISTIKSIKNYLIKGQILILESTTYPGTTDEILVPFLRKLGFVIGKDFFLAYSPEREDPGNKMFKDNQIPKILGGYTSECGYIGKKIYELVSNKIVLMSSLKAAEMSKLIENVYRAINIGLVNELKEFSNFLGIDLFEVIKAASTKPFGFQPFFPGPGVGGHCIPVDPYFLSWKAKQYDFNLKLIDLAGEINESMPAYVFKKVSVCLSARLKKLDESEILILGLAYKKNIDDLRESPSLEIINLLRKEGVTIFYNDPYLSEETHEELSKINIQKVEINNNIQKYDCVILLTDHDSYDYDLIKEKSKLIIDTRGRYSETESIIRA